MWCPQCSYPSWKSGPSQPSVTHRLILWDLESPSLQELCSPSELRKLGSLLHWPDPRTMRGHSPEKVYCGASHPNSECFRLSTIWGVIHAMVFSVVCVFQANTYTCFLLNTHFLSKHLHYKTHLEQCIANYKNPLASRNLNNFQRPIKNILILYLLLTSPQPPTPGAQ